MRRWEFGAPFLSSISGLHFLAQHNQRRKVLANTGTTVLRPKRPESIDSLSYFGEDAVVSKNLWPARSPDLSTWYCFLCGALKQKACRNNSHTLADANNFITVGICGYRV
ncbi:hypothetical protein Cfor_08802, partial [Coptotermes formosanus]